MSTPGLDAAVEVFRDLGWATATLEDVENLPLGTPEQRAAARAGLAAGPWREHHRWDDSIRGYRWTSLVGGVDEHLLTAFALRQGVDALRAVELLERFPLPGPLAARLLAPHGPRLARRVADLVARRPWTVTTPLSAAAVSLVDLHDLPVPASRGYLEHWVAQTSYAVPPEGRQAAAGTAVLARATVLRRATEHLRAAREAGVPPLPSFGGVLAAVVEQGLVPRDEALEIAVAGLDSAQRPGDRTAWTRLLTGPLGATDGELLDRADVLVPALAHGDPAVVEALAPPLVAGVPEDLLADVLTVALLVRSRKARRLVLATAASRPRPADHVVEAVAPLVAPMTTAPDRPLGRAATALVTAWGADVDVDPEPDGGPVVVARWLPTPPLWDVPRFDVGPVTPDALTAAAAALTGRPADVVDVHVEQLLALATAVAYTDPAAARTALAGVRPSEVAGLRCVPDWLAGTPSRLRDTPGHPATSHRSWPLPALVRAPVDAREAAVVGRWGEIPVMLSMPTWVDLRIDPADLVVRLQAYADAGVAVSEGDLHLALTRTDVSLATADVRSALERLAVPVLQPDQPAPDRGLLARLRSTWQGHSDGAARLTAGPVAARYLTDPVLEPALRRSADGRRWEPGAIVVPASLAGLPARLTALPAFAPLGAETLPTWGDAAGTWIRSSETADAGLRLRQAVRRGTPLPPGLAANVVGAQRGFHPVAAPDGTTAVLEAWERGLLRPGAADVRLLDWSLTPTALASFARACVELAADGLLAVVWPLLDDVLAASLTRSRLPAGTSEVAEAVQSLLPAVRAAVVEGTAPASALELPGTRALARRGGTSRAVVAACAVTAELPERRDPPAPTTAALPAPSFDEVWPVDAGTRPAVVDGAVLTVRAPDHPGAPPALDVALPDGSTYRVRKTAFHELEQEGQCEAASLPLPESGRRHADSWLRWDVGTERIVVSPYRNWRDGSHRPPTGPDVPPLTTSMVAVLLLGLSTDSPYTAGQVRATLGSRLVGSAAVTHAVRALLPSEHVNPGHLVRPLDVDAATLPVLWPVLVESVRHAATFEGSPPRWVHRVLDVALHRAPLLREAVSRGLLPADAAAWPGLADLAASARSATVRRKAAALAEQVLGT
ncbi:DUF6493 family protein [Cellulomonas sp. KH9]|uniref:DUF7824 domain-containing protein n=1 Tax=Cellulomonas sp. KH9 TaxID=1855324 RepID=UPI0008EB8BE9|nr:DUF6493 family protein [Cellulomonas sp. KH9]SFK14527.1 hypothetical protein SAMN05216467_2172 [Cellulomonas sp. KH9]